VQTDVHAARMTLCTDPARASHGPSKIASFLVRAEAVDRDSMRYWRREHVASPARSAPPSYSLSSVPSHLGVGVPSE